MATLFRRSNGIYYLVTKIGGRQTWKSTGSTSKSGALKFVSDLERKVLQKPEISLRQFASQFLETAKVNLAPTTVSLYKQAFKAFERIAGDNSLGRFILPDLDQPIMGVVFVVNKL